MTLPSFQYYVGVTLTLKAIDAPATTETVYLISDTCNNVPDAYVSRLWPILVNVSEVGVQAGEIMPEMTTGAFTVRNDIGTFGYNRKLSDLLQRYTPINQTVTVHLIEAALSAWEGGVFTLSAANTVWSGHCESVTNPIQDGANMLVFNIASDAIPDVPRTMALQSGLTNMTDPGTNLGKYIPLCAGDCLVPGYAVESDFIEDTLTWAGATNIVDNFASVIIASGTYVQDYDGNWIQAIGNSGWLADISSGTAGVNSYALDSVAERIFKIPLTSNATTGAVTLTLKPGGSATVTAQITGTIYEIDKTENVPLRAIAEAVLDLSAYGTENNGADQFTVKMAFDTIPVMNYALYDYAFGLKAGTVASTDPTWVKTATNAKNWVRDATDTFSASGWAWKYDASELAAKYVLSVVYAQSIAESGEDKAGLAASIVLLDNGASEVDVNWENINPILYIRGLRDDDSGTLTGSPNTSLVQPDLFIKAITYNYSGSWAASTAWDWTTLATQYTALFASSGTRTRQLQGYLEGRVSLHDVIASVCRDTACRVGITNAGKMFLWPWGFAHTVADYIPPVDIRPESWSIADPSTVINKVSVSYDKSLINTRLERQQAAADYSNYNGFIEWADGSNAKATLLTHDSEELYGTRETEQVTTNWIASDQSAETLAEYYLARYSKPLETCSFIVPYHTYKALKMFDVIEAAHPEWPTYYGATPEDRPLVDSAAASCGTVNLTEGHQLYRCQKYRLQIEGRSILLPLDAAPQIRLRCRVLNNYPKDPT